MALSTAGSGMGREELEVEGEGERGAGSRMRKEELEWEERSWKCNGKRGAGMGREELEVEGEERSWNGKRGAAVEGEALAACSGRRGPAQVQYRSCTAGGTPGAGPHALPAPRGSGANWGI